MSITTKLTLQQLTPPGYFDLTESAPTQHKAYMTWFQNVLTWMSGQAAGLFWLRDKYRRRSASFSSQADYRD